MALCDTDQSRRDLDELRAQADQIPVAERVAWVESEDGRNHLENVEFAMRERRKSPSFAETVSRSYEYTAPRPKGVKPRICADVAAEHGREDIGPRYVQRCWDEFRAIRKQLTADR